MSISAEEFQQFQSQLLDLREANITANEAKRRAEHQVKQLEAKISSFIGTGGRSKDADRIKSLEDENNQLREKVISTEASFQLQCSTLKTECHELFAEVNRLTNELEDHKKSVIFSDGIDWNTTASPNVSVQTIHPVLVDTVVQAANLSTSNAGVQTDLPDSNDLQISLDAYCDLLQSVVTSLRNRVTSIEVALVDLTNAKRQAIVEQQLMSDQIVSLDRALSASKSLESDLRTQLIANKNRSRQINKEMRLQMTRLLRSAVAPSNSESSAPTGPTGGLGEPEADSIPQCQNNLNPPQGHRRENSITSSISSAVSCSSLSSIITPSTPVVNTEVTEHFTKDEPPKIDANACPTHPQLKIPQGFLSVSDFKDLVDRMSEVQEENCTLRHRLHRLEADLTAKSKALQLHIQRHLSAGDSTCPPTGSSSAHGQTWLSSLRSPFGTSTAGLGQSQTSVETVNRLKKLCEDLLTENLRLRHRLDEVSPQTE